MPSQLGVAVEDDRRTLGAERVLVEVHRHAGDAGHGEIEVGDLGSHGAPQRQKEPADATVHVEQHVALGGHGPDLADRVDRSMRERACRCNDQNRLIVDGRSEGVDVGPARLRVDRRDDRVDAEVLAALVERRMPGDRNDDVGPGDVGLVLAGPIASRLHCEHAALGAATGERADDVLTSTEVACGHGGYFALEPGKACDRGRVEPVLPQVHRVRLFGDLPPLVGSEKDVGHHLAALPRDVVGLVRRQLFEDLVLGRSLRW